MSSAYRLYPGKALKAAHELALRDRAAGLAITVQDRSPGQEHFREADELGGSRKQLREAYGEHLGITEEERV